MSCECFAPVNLWDVSRRNAAGWRRTQVRSQGVGDRRKVLLKNYLAVGAVDVVVDQTT